MEKLSLIIADKGELFREGLTRILGSQPQFGVVNNCSTGLECIDGVRGLEPNIVLLDTQIKNCNFLETLVEIKHISPDTRVIILTHSEEGEDIFAAFKFGASAYITKDVGCKDLIADIVRVHKGVVIIGTPISDKVVQELGNIGLEGTISKHGTYGLSHREIEILALVTKGDTNREIATNLLISENTVKVYMSRILGKLQVHNRQQAAIFVMGKRFMKY